jgi:hypothetical protein
LRRIDTSTFLINVERDAGLGALLGDNPWLGLSPQAARSSMRKVAVRDAEAEISDLWVFCAAAYLAEAAERDVHQISVTWIACEARSRRNAVDGEFATAAVAENDTSPRIWPPMFC